MPFFDAQFYSILTQTWFGQKNMIPPGGAKSAAADHPLLEVCLYAGEKLVSWVRESIEQSAATSLQRPKARARKCKCLKFPSEIHRNPLNPPWFQSGVHIPHPMFHRFPQPCALLQASDVVAGEAKARWKWEILPSYGNFFRKKMMDKWWKWSDRPDLGGTLFSHKPMDFSQWLLVDSSYFQFVFMSSPACIWSPCKIHI